MHENIERQRLEKIITRISPINLKDLYRIKQVPNESGLQLIWKQNQNALYSSIDISFTTTDDAKSPRTLDWSNRPTLVLSNVETGVNKPDYTRNWDDGIRALLSLFATVQDISTKIGPISHIVRANNHSKSFFELLVKAGIYYYSDESGIPVQQSKAWAPSGGLANYTLYCCKFPNTVLPNLERFVVKEFSSAIVDYYSKNTQNNTY